ncbi:exosortase A [Photobacterium japonica]|uniref:exosortase A n=1 Tax=Photobacterium japonica TaxID=2910235 RepID=UPI003D0A3286
MIRNRATLVLIPMFCWGLIFYSSVIDMVTVWSQSKTYEHCFLILPIFFWLVWQKRHALQEQPQDIALVPIILIPLPGLLWLVGKTAGVSLFEHAAAIFSLQLLIWALLGTARAKQIWFPICYLVFCIPFGEELVPALQDITADLSMVMLSLSGIAAYRDGLYITIPNGQFVVAEACSGIRFLISSLALGTLFAYLQFAKLWKRVAFVGFSFIFPIIANGIRAYGIIVIGYLSDMKHATGADHLVYGWLFFSIVIICIFMTASFFADPPEATSQHAVSSNAQSQHNSKSIGLLSALLVCIALWGQSIQQPTANVEDTSALLAETMVTKDHLPRAYWGIQFPYSSHDKLATNENGDTYFYTARYALNQTQGELISSENSLYDKESWSLHSTQPLPLGNDTDATTLSLIDQNGRTMEVIYWYCINDFCTSDPLALKLYKAGHLITGGDGYADVFAIASRKGAQAQHYAKRWQQAAQRTAE